MSAVARKRTSSRSSRYVRLVPQGDIRTCSKIAAYRAPSPFGSWFDQSPDQRLFKSLAAFVKCRVAAAFAATISPYVPAVVSAQSRSTLS
jgi:hypothetical protein